MEAVLFMLNLALVVYLCRLIVKMDKSKDKTNALHIFSYKDKRDAP